jgi:hypothetical protein
VALSDLTSRTAVESALGEFDSLGRDTFLQKYGFGRSRRYFVSRDGKYYDSKAIAGAAVGFEYPERGPMTNTEFSGGEHGAKAKLEELGFEVVAKPALAAADTLPLRDALETALRAQRERKLGDWSDDLQKVIAVTLQMRFAASLDSTSASKAVQALGIRPRSHGCRSCLRNSRERVRANTSSTSSPPTGRASS